MGESSVEMEKMPSHGRSEYGAVTSVDTLTRSLGGESVRRKREILWGCVCNGVCARVPCPAYRQVYDAILVPKRQLDRPALLQLAPVDAHPDAERLQYKVLFRERGLELARHGWG
jgi:hypothetical protein